MGLLHLKRILNTNDLGVLYECIFPEYIIRFTIYADKRMRIKAYVWGNDHDHREGPGTCLREFLASPYKKEAKLPAVNMPMNGKRGSGYDTFEDMDTAWTTFYDGRATNV